MAIADLEREMTEMKGDVRALTVEVKALAARLTDHDGDDQARHRELREDFRAGQRELFRLLFAGLAVIFLAMCLMAGLVGVKLYIDSRHVEIQGPPPVTLHRQEP